MTIVRVGAVSLQVKREAQRGIFIEGLLKQIEERVQQLVGRCIEEALETEVTGLLRRRWHERRPEDRYEWTEAACPRCGSHNALDFRRNGHYSRGVDTKWGRVRISMPQVACRCGGQVSLPLQTLQARQRIWDDVAREIRKRYSWGMSLRWIKEWLDAQLRSSVGLRTLNERVQELARLVPGWHQRRMGRVPPVVQVDGIWVTQMVSTGKWEKDRLNRRRPVKQAQKVPVLVAQGVWPATGEQEVIAWVMGQAEDEASWETLLTQMWERGITPERGLRLLVADGAAGFKAAHPTVYWDVPIQRCVFHKLRNLWRAIVVPEELEGKPARAYRRRFIRSVARIWQAPDAKTARRRQRRLCAQWEIQQPQAVATLRRDFEATLTFYQLQEQLAQQGAHWPAHRLRTTSPLERTFRAFRRRFRQAVLFHSSTGLSAVMHQLISHQRVARIPSTPLAWHFSLERALACTPGIS